MLDDPLTPEQWARQQYPDDTIEQLAERAMRALALQSHWGKHVLWNLVKRHRLDVKRGPMDLAILGGLQIPLRQAKLWTNGEHGGNYLAITDEELDAVLRGVQRCEADPSLWETVSKQAKKQND